MIKQLSAQECKQRTLFSSSEPKFLLNGHMQSDNIQSFKSKLLHQKSNLKCFPNCSVKIFVNNISNLHINIYMISSLAQPSLLCLITNFHTSIRASNQACCPSCHLQDNHRPYYFQAYYTRQGNDIHVMTEGWIKGIFTCVGPPHTHHSVHTKCRKALASTNHLLDSMVPVSRTAKYGYQIKKKKFNIYKYI